MEPVPADASLSPMTNVECRMSNEKISSFVIRKFVILFLVSLSTTDERAFFRSTAGPRSARPPRAGGVAIGEAQSVAGGARVGTSFISGSSPAARAQLASLDGVGGIAVHDERRVAAGGRRVFCRESHVSDRGVHAVSRDVRHPRPAAGGARHARRLAVVDRGLAVRARRGGTDAQRSGRCWRFRLGRSSGSGARSTRS